MSTDQPSMGARKRLTPMHGALAVAILALLVMPFAIAGAASGPEATASAVTTAKFKKLKKRVAALEGKLNQQATGDLTGIYPNLQIGPAAVGTGELADDAVNNAKIADDAVNSAEIATSAVRAAELGPTTTNTGAGGTDQGGVATTASCTGAGQMLSGGGLWSGTIGASVWINGAYPVSTATWAAQGNNATGADRTLTTHVLCLAP